MSMVANEEDDAHADWLCQVDSERLISAAAIYGVNAAGKSNILKAMTVAIRLVRYSNLRGINDFFPEIIPFLFDEETRMNPTRFDFIFIYNRKKYRYGFSLDKYVILEEYLYLYERSDSFKIFERTNTDQYSFSKGNEKRFNEYAEKNTSNKLFLATATAWNYAETRDAYLWFAGVIDVYDFNGISSEGLDIIEEGDKALKAFLIETLRESDFNIADYSFEAIPMTLDDLKKVECLT